MIYDFSVLRPKSSYPTYPCYHKDLYLEDYFFQYYLRNKEKFDAKGRTFLPISWTTLYVENTQVNIQDYLRVLDPRDSYLAVSQHDEGIRQQLPPNTLHFAAGGLGGGIPIPLICSPIPNPVALTGSSSTLGYYYHQVPIEDYDDSIDQYFCSFVGSMTHNIRAKLYNTYKDTKGYYFSNARPWNQTVTDNQLAQFISTTQQSTFALAPRGYGLSSFRLYEILQLGTIPVYVSDKHWLPFTHKLNWSEFCVIVKEEDIPNLNIILRGITSDERNAMRKKGREVWENYFTLESCCNQILEMI